MQNEVVADRWSLRLATNKRPCIRGLVYYARSIISLYSVRLWKQLRPVQSSLLLTGLRLRDLKNRTPTPTPTPTLHPCLGTMYGVHLGLIGKRVVDFLLVLIELFFARCYGWGATSKYRLKIGDFAPRGGGSWPKISSRSGRPPPTIYSFLRKTRLNDLSYGIKIWTDLSSVLSQVTRLTDGPWTSIYWLVYRGPWLDGETSRQTDRQKSHR